MESRTKPFVPSLCLSLLLIVHTAVAQDVGKIQGRIVDAETKQPIANAQVVILGVRSGAGDAPRDRAVILMRKV